MLAEAVFDSPCRDHHGADVPSTEASFDAGSDIGKLHTADTPICASCAGDCGTTASPFVHEQPAGLPVIAALSVQTPVRVTSHLPPTPHRLDRPPSDRLP